MSDWSAWISSAVVRWRWPLLAAGIVLAIAAWGPSHHLPFDRSLENMFSPDDPLLGPFHRLQRTFGASELVMAVYSDADLLKPDGSGIARLTKISQTLQGVKGVRDVLSLERPIGPDIVDPESEVSARMRDLFAGYTHSKDGKTVAIVCLLKTEAEAQAKLNVSRVETINKLRTTLQDELTAAGLGEGMLAGEPVMVNDGFRFVEEDGKRLGWVSTILLGLTILLCFRSIRWVIIPIAVVQMTILVTMATLAWSGVRLSMVSSMLVAILTVVGIAAVVHIIVRFRELRQEGLKADAALIAAGAALAAPIFWSLLTDVAGFGSLVFARVGPVQDFGLMCAVGSMLVAVPCLLLIPGLALAGEFDSDPQQAWGEGGLDLALDGVIGEVRRRPMMIASLSIGAAAIASAGAFWLEVESDFTRNFRPDSSVVRSYDFIETHLGGAGVWDVMIPAPKKLDLPYLEHVARLEDRLRKEVGAADDRENPGAAQGRKLTKVFSVADAGFEGAPVDPRTVPVTLFSSPEFALQTQLTAMSIRLPVFFRTLHAEDPQTPGKYWLRIMLRAEERQSAAQKKDLIERVTKIAREEFPEAEVTGFFVLLANLIESVIRDNWTTFGLATAGISLMLFVAFLWEIRATDSAERPAPSWLMSIGWSIRLTLIAPVPNVMPVLVVTGLVGWLGLPINMGAAMIAAVSMGLSVDSSLHYLCSYLRLRAAGESFHQALTDVQRSVGRAMVFSTLALVVGFLVLCISEFVPTIYFGALAMLTMLGGMAGNLIVLPVLLQLVEGEDEKAEVGEQKSEVKVQEAE